jgi:LmbE family N-acetylglucosaminyl deacetylase
VEKTSASSSGDGLEAVVTRLTGSGRQARASRGVRALRSACLTALVSIGALSAQIDEIRTNELARAVASGAPAYGGGITDLACAVRDTASDRHVVVVASHPDDQYLMLAARFRGHGDRVTAVLLTRGEGGQNSIGPEVGQALGLLRTLETEAAAALLGFHVHHLDLEDDGFCRTAEEALETWGRRNTTDRLAKAFRELRPDLVVTTHHPDETHGHDLALVEVLPAALERSKNPRWEAPGDTPPYAVPDALRGVGLGDDGRTTEIDLTEIDRVRQRSFRDLAYDALIAAHRSQGPFRPKHELFPARLRFVRVPGCSAANDAPLDPDRSSGRGLAARTDDPEVGAIVEDLASLQATLLRPAELLEHAISLRERLFDLEMRRLDLREHVRARVAALERVILHSAGIRVLAAADSEARAVRGTDLSFDLEIQAGDLPFVPSTVWTPARGVASLTVLAGDEPTPRADGRIELERTVVTRVVAEIRPEDDAPSILDPRTVLSSPRFSLPLALRMTVELPGTSRPIDVEVPLPFDVRSGISLRIEPSALFVPNGLRSIPFNVTAIRLPGAESPTRPLDVDVRLGLLVQPSIVRPRLTRPTRAWDHVFRLEVSETLETGVSHMNVRLGDERLRVRVSRVDCNVPTGLRVGLIRGVDDTSADVLRSLRGLVELVTLGPDELPTRDLRDLDSVLVDIRALAHRPDVGAAFDRLFEFAEGGGRLVVLYHKAAEFNVEESGFRAFPPDSWLHIGKGRVTREDAPVRILDPQHAIFRIPNRIEASDWDGWVHERGLYFADDWSDRYFQPLIELADPGQPIERGALLYARVGSGEYVYCALSLYRQLRSLNPGACRLFVNLITPLRRLAERR